MGRLLGRRICGLVAVAAAVVGAGCPTQPQLNVSPLAISLGTANTSDEFRINNTGDGTLNWSATENLPWLSVEEAVGGGKQGTTVSGSATDETDVVRVVVDRTQLQFGVNTGEIQVTSNGGAQTVMVSVERSAPAALVVSPGSLDFGTTNDTGVVTISNSGRQQLSWALAIPETAPWLSASLTNGTLGSEESVDVTLTLARETLASGTFSATVAITSNGGNADVAVSASQTAFRVQPANIAFGSILTPQEQTLRILNDSGSTLNFAVGATTVNGGAWLGVSSALVTIPGNNETILTITANPVGLAPASYSGNVRVTDVTGNFSIDVPVTMEVAGYTVTPRQLNFGALSATTSDTFQIVNESAEPLPFNITVPAAASTWLSVQPSSGNVTGTQTVTVTVNPANVAAGPQEAVLTLNIDGNAETVNVTFQRLPNARLVVVPESIDFGTADNVRELAIWNEGPGTLNWTIDTTGFPAWLTLNGPTSGSVTGDQTAALELIVNRAQVPAGQNDFEDTFTVSSTGAVTQSVEVTVSGAIPLVPVITVIADGLTTTGDHFLTFTTEVSTRDFIIRNDGNGPLNFSIPTDGQPDFLTLVSPPLGSLEPGQQRSVTVNVSRETLDYRGSQTELLITAPDLDPVTLVVEVQVAKQVAVTARPETLAFGENRTTDFIEVANTGDPETRMEFRVSTTKEWISVFPSTGESIGTEGPFKDFKPISVTIDRSLLDEDSASGKVIITPFLVENGQAIPQPGVAPAEVEVSAVAANLTIETAVPRLRVPSIVRYVMMMRNIRYQALPIPDSRLDQIAPFFSITENDQVLEATETNQFLSSQRKIRGNLVILLDFSGSMQESARKVTDQDVAQHPDPIFRVYERAVSSLIEEIPSNYRIGLAVFNERDGERFITDSPAETADTNGKILIEDRDVLLSRLSNIDVTDNGASALLPAIDSVAEFLALQDIDRNFVPYDDADVRGIICITDGRLTSPPGSITETATFLEDLKVRLFAVGWGDTVAADPLIRLAQPSGGHLYSTRTEKTGEQDPFGNDITRPVVAELEDWTSTLADPCDQSIARDLSSQVVLTYITLNEAPGVTTEIFANFDDPNDQTEVCLPDQGDISGGFGHTGLPYSAVAFDVRLGQISLRSNGISNGEALVRARLEYAPRNVTQYSFRIVPDSGSINVSASLQSEGGVLHDWNLQQAGDVYTFTSPDGAPLRYGEFGDMLEIQVTGASDPLQLAFEVLAPEISASPNSKYVSHPDTITLEGTEDVVAPALPWPIFTIQPGGQEFNGGNRVINLPSAAPVSITIENGGGSHEPTGVGLRWRVVAAANVEDEFEPVEGVNYSTLEQEVVQLPITASASPGPKNPIFEVLDISTEPPTVFMRIQFLYTVDPPVLDVSPESLDFGAVENELPLSITNTGESVLNWSLDGGSFPRWLDASRFAGELLPGQSQTTNIRVDRAGEPSGIQSFNLVVTGEDPGGASDQTQTVTVQMAVP